ncbi:DtxR family transcriptional regulator [Microlunatus endophyticus]|uniref:DtxR family transcriptional regulator n=1 Tax=Microlunatus endophyticus TaxID=1716077 RepID=A0A917W2N5_9ACTN|nr:metal-dependent transcriptional regulator [Microlunatus endophyticus]GGL56072.1 DtxR family transcriptional regulator [Microlunatus endophyticus]
MPVDDLVNTAEMYLKAMLELEEEGVVAMRARLVERFEQASPTVSQTVERLQRHGLVEVEADRHLTLTDLGRRTAASVMRKHRLAEVFLEQVVGFDWELLHEEACRWEHVMSDQLADRLDELLGHPRVTPYGNPVRAPHPDRPATSTDRPQNLTRLGADLDDKLTARIIWIGEPLQADTAALASLRQHGLLPGTEVTISAADGHWVTLRRACDDFDLELPYELAVHLFAMAEVPAPLTADA